MECIFCDIINRKASAEIIYENETVISFLDIRPLNHGHALVIPKKHYKDFLSLPPDEFAEVSKAVQVVSRAINESINPDGINIIINSGIAAGQTVFHFHYHIIPRFLQIILNLNLYLKNMN